MLIHCTCFPIYRFLQLFCRKLEALRFNEVFALLRFLQRVVKAEVAKNDNNVFLSTPLIKYIPLFIILCVFNRLPIEVDLLHFRFRNLGSSDCRKLDFCLWLVNVLLYKDAKFHENLTVFRP